MAAVSGAKTRGATLTSTTADAVTLTDPVEHVYVTNGHASVLLYVTIKSGTTVAGAAGATTAVAAADGTILIPPYQTKKVFASPGSKRYVSLSVVGNANPYQVEGTNYPRE